MVKKILSVYSANNKLVVTAENGSNKVIKILIPLSYFETLCNCTYPEFICEMNNSLEELETAKKVVNNTKSKTIKPFDSRELVEATIPKGKKTISDAKRETTTPYIKIQGKYYPTELFEELLDLSYDNFILTLDLIKDTKEISYEDLLMKYNLKKLGMEEAKTNNTKRVYIMKGATNYLKDNNLGYLSKMYDYEGNIGYVVDKGTDDIVTVNVVNKIKKDGTKEGFQFQYPKQFLVAVKEV